MSSETFRKTKREILAAENLGDRDLMLAKSIKLKSQTAAYSDFSRAAKLKPQKERMQAGGFGRGIAQRSVAATKKKEAALDYISMEEYKKLVSICQSKATEKERLFYAITLSAHVQNMCLMCQSINQCSGKNRILEDFFPSIENKITCDHY